MTEQEKFEGWVKNPHMLNKSTSPDDCGKYTHPWTIGAWKGWQAAIESREPRTIGGIVPLSDFQFLEELKKLSALDRAILACVMMKTFIPEAER